MPFLIVLLSTAGILGLSSYTNLKQSETNRLSAESQIPTTTVLTRPSTILLLGGSAIILFTIIKK